MFLTGADGIVKALFSHPSLLPLQEKSDVLELVCHDWHSASPLVILIACPMMFIPTKKPDTGTLEPKSTYGFRVEVPFQRPKD